MASNKNNMVNAKSSHNKKNDDAGITTTDANNSAGKLNV